MLLGRRGPAPGLAVTGDHAAREDVEDRIVLDRAHKVGRLHDLVGGVQAPGRPRVRQSYLQDQQAERVSPSAQVSRILPGAFLRARSNCLQSRDRVRERKTGGINATTKRRGDAEGASGMKRSDVLRFHYLRYDCGK